MPPEVVLLTTSEVANLFRVHRNTIHSWIKSGQLSPVDVPGRNKRYRKADVEAILAGEAKTEGAA